MAGGIDNAPQMNFHIEVVMAGMDTRGKCRRTHFSPAPSASGFIGTAAAVAIVVTVVTAVILASALAGVPIAPDTAVLIGP
jgi:hypothetical protein